MTERETRRIRHTLEAGAVNLTGGPYHISFPDTGVLTVEADRAAELVENHPLVEYAVEIPDDYATLQKMAARVENGAVDGNSQAAAIRAYLETLSDGELEELRP